MTISARNQLTGTVSHIADGAVNDEVELTLNSGGKLVAVVTRSSKEALGLKPGKEAIALIKAPWVMLATEDCGLQFSARNQFPGKVRSLARGAVNTTVSIATDGGAELTAIVTNEAADDMALKDGSRLIALVKASSVLLAVKK
ncbi:molybdopterin-binding protein [Buttiauxella noackiae]|jgi:molybdopterin-binding protein|uniref:ModE family molybdate-binding protein n=1 Tax=Buttiauxella noackiae ATCC 51607 TaxID=1354255 RepID=A0A1B7HUW5_9ENTR|nr:TOBE domain-containing protein [Buttiauxella noackiae]OAT19455.1 ModE family molybdate-binding protein [Buttiauxella noackiae ATCC 51607]